MTSEPAQFRIERGGLVALWRQVAEHLGRRIDAGEWPDGRMPSHRHLAAEYDVPGSVVSVAIAELSAHGKAFTVQGGGTYVASSRAEPEVPRRRKAPARGDDRRAGDRSQVTQPIVDDDSIRHLSDGILDFARRALLILDKIYDEVSCTTKLVRNIPQRLALLERAVVTVQAPAPAASTDQVGDDGDTALQS